MNGETPNRKRALPCGSAVKVVGLAQGLPARERSREDARKRSLLSWRPPASAAPLETGLSCSKLSLPCRLRHDTDNAQRLEFKSLRQKAEQHSGIYIRAVAFVVLLYAHAKLGPLPS